MYLKNDDDPDLIENNIINFVKENLDNKQEDGKFKLTYFKFSLSNKSKIRKLSFDFLFAYVMLYRKGEIKQLEVSEQILV